MKHLSQISMEFTESFQDDADCDEQAKDLHAIQPLDSDEVLNRTVRGQYGEGVLGGERVPGYRSEPGVSPDSRTETYVAMTLTVDNWRWSGVPFCLRTAKRRAKRRTEIAS